MDRRIETRPAKEVVTALLPSALPVAFYRRVSNDELKERGTIENQRHYLYRKYDADLAPDSPQPLTLVELAARHGSRRMRDGITNSLMWMERLQQNSVAPRLAHFVAIRATKPVERSHE